MVLVLPSVFRPLKTQGRAYCLLGFGHKKAPLRLGAGNGAQKGPQHVRLGALGGL